METVTLRAHAHLSPGELGCEHAPGPAAPADFLALQAPLAQRPPHGDRLLASGGAEFGHGQGATGAVFAEVGHGVRRLYFVGHFARFCAHSASLNQNLHHVAPLVNTAVKKTMTSAAVRPPVL